MQRMSSAEMSEALLRELYKLRDLTDELIEEGLVQRWSVSEMLGALLPRVGESLGATGAFVETYGEDLAIHVFLWGGAAGKPLSIPDKAEVWDRTSEEKRERVARSNEKQVLVAQHLDVAGEWFGRAGLVAPSGADANRLQEALNAV